MACPTMASGVTERTRIHTNAPARPAAVGSDLSTTSSSAGAEILSVAAALSNAARTGSSACAEQRNGHWACIPLWLWLLQAYNQLLCVPPMHAPCNSKMPKTICKKYSNLSLQRAVLLLSEGQPYVKNMPC